MAARKTTKKTTLKTSAKPKAAKKKAPAKQERVASKAVNMGNLFALRPRVNTSFRQEDFFTARRLLEDESYATPEEAARAVAERALELSNDPGSKRGRKHGR